MLEGQPNQIHRTINHSPYITGIAIDYSRDNCK